MLRDIILKLESSYTPTQSEQQRRGYYYFTSLVLNE